LKGRSWAVVIGIGNYPENSMKLSGPRNDATLVKDFFSNRLGFNVVTLLDEEATRENIFEALNSHLLKNKRINRGDPVVIYYAGNGAVYPASRFRIEDEGYVEAILPVDRGQYKDGRMVPDIHDFELGDFLKRLSEKRTGNITVVFDSCTYSVAVRREIANGPPGKVRGANPLADIPSDIRELYRSKRDSLLRPKDHSSPHVYISACQDYEYAWEDQNEGMFTKLLLRLLNQLSLSSLSYEQLEEAFHDRIPRQQPVIYGTSKRDLLFRIEDN
jgi:uncharacterized protein (DUF2267 family)